MRASERVTAGTRSPEEAWQRVCAEEDVWPGEMSFRVLPGGIPVLLVNPDGRIRAFHGLCPHQATSLAAADFDGDVIVCPGHLWEFDACTGAGVNPVNTRLREWPTTVRSGELFVNVTPEGR